MEDVRVSRHLSTSYFENGIREPALPDVYWLRISVIRFDGCYVAVRDRPGIDRFPKLPSLFSVSGLVGKGGKGMEQLRQSVRKVALSRHINPDEIANL